MFRKLTVPETHTFTNPATGEPTKVVDEQGNYLHDLQMTGREFLESLLYGSQWKKDLKTLRLSSDLQEMFSTVEGGDELIVPEEAWELLKQHCTPSAFKNTEHARQLDRAGFFSAVLDAPKCKKNADRKPPEKRPSRKKSKSGTRKRKR